MDQVHNPTSITSAAAHEALPEAQTISAVILAGRLRQAPLQEAINLHPLCLPVSERGTVLETWLAALGTIPRISQTRVVVNSESDATSVRGVLPRELRDRVEVMAEPASWRGAGGIVRDVTNGLSDQSIVLVCEGTRLPPRSLAPLLEALYGADVRTGQEPQGVVGVVDQDTPAGVYMFRRNAIAIAPRVGYYDLKEQLLPALARNGHRVVLAHVESIAPRLRDRETYLRAVESSLKHDRLRHVVNNAEAGDSSMLRVSARASVSGSAVLDGFCIIEPGAVIEDGAVVHESVVLWGATVGGGAVVSRSIVGPLASVEPRTRVVREIVARR